MMPYAATKERLSVTRERNLIKSFLKKKRRLFNFLDDENVVNNNLASYYFNKFYVYMLFDDQSERKLNEASSLHRDILGTHLSILLCSLTSH
jgi:hypothetical protein